LASSVKEEKDKERETLKKFLSNYEEKDEEFAGEDPMNLRSAKAKKGSSRAKPRQPPPQQQRPTPSQLRSQQFKGYRKELDLSELPI